RRDRCGARQVRTWSRRTAVARGPSPLGLASSPPAVALHGGASGDTDTRRGEPRSDAAWRAPYRSTLHPITGYPTMGYFYPNVSRACLVLRTTDDTRSLLSAG